MNKGWKSDILLITYLVIGILNVTGEQYELNKLILFTKPLLIPILMVWFHISTKNNRLGRLIQIALLSAWFGDVTLLIHHQSVVELFILGIGFFAITQILYTYCLYKCHGKSFFENRVALLIMLVLLSSIMAYLLPKTDIPYLVPVAIYSILISAMVYQALTVFFVKTKRYILLIGAIFFYISDLLIALDSFAGISFHWLKSGTLIMVTYISAQFLISKGFNQTLKHRLIKADSYQTPRLPT